MKKISSPIKEIRAEHIRGKVKFKAGAIEGISGPKYKHRKETDVFRPIEKKD